MTKLHELAELGQSIWLDYIRRALITSGELQELVDKGLRGMTSNPSIFEQAIAGSADYDDQLGALLGAELSPEQIYEALAIQDIRAAADILRPVFDASDGRDGFVSLEVGPDIAGDTERTAAEARRLAAAVGRPNVMIKVPATAAGIPAIRQLIGEGRNINITLMFSLADYDAVAEAYLSGLEALAERGGDLSRVASVASFFLSRIDSAVDEQLEAMGAHELSGRAAIANAKVAYQRFLATFSGQRWERLAAQGARVQRVLWASTSAKDPTYPDTMYVDSLIGPDTINTVPPATLQAFLDHGTVALTLTEGVEQARADLARLAELGIDLDAITARLQVEGVEKFSKPYGSLMKAITAKMDELAQGETLLEARLGRHEAAVDEAVARLKADRIMGRIWEHDHTVWRPAPDEIANRLAWLHAPEAMEEAIDRIGRLIADVRADGYSHAVVLGMGGSSLAPEVFANVFAGDHDGLSLEVLDSTDPAAVLALDRRLDYDNTLFVVSTKSGTTTETLSFLNYFYNRTVEELGREAGGPHFVAITDPGSKLDALAQELGFRAIFRNDPNVGGRYSALTYFGLVPAGLVGVDLAALLGRAETMVRNTESCNCPRDGDNAGGVLGAMLGVLAGAGRDKLTFVVSAALANFGDWIEQLVAESTGKDGRGILPVVGEPLGPPAVYGDDRIFVHLRLAGDDSHDEALQGLAAAGHPLITLQLNDRYDLGGQMFLWEMATAVAGHLLGIQPFDQPNVEAAKKLARQMTDAYRREGRLPQGETAPLAAGALREFLSQAEPSDYLALQAYVSPTTEIKNALQELRLRLRDETRLATTLGYGPRFLHSTGQLHKGDAGRGRFIQFTAAHALDVAIPDAAGANDSAITFGTLIDAQALGDAQALREAGRSVIRFHLGPDPAADIERLAAGPA